MKIDKRKNYYIVFDTETANGLEDPIMYDLGFAVIDKKGNVYEAHSYIIREVFFGMVDLMQSAYYAEKIPEYKKQIAKGERKVVSLFEAKRFFTNVCKKYNVKVAIAHNARFDYRSTSTTQRYITKSKYRFFLPYGVELWDTMKMANDTICKQKSYKKWCHENGYITKNNQVRKTAEILYRYISGKHDFIESHTGLEDVLIEKEIFVHCLRQHKPMRKNVSPRVSPRRGPARRIIMQKKLIKIFYKKLLTNHFPYGIINTDRKGVNKMLDKAILHGKEHRKPYYGSKSYSCSCRNHGGCPWCEGNRLYNAKRKLEKSNYSLKNYLTDC